MNLVAIQKELRARGYAGWLFYDHHRRDPIAYRILGLPEGMASRRWYYLIPAQGAPRKLVHRIESGALDALPGGRAQYSQWGELSRGLKELLAPLGPHPRVAMQYSPGCALPLISMVDGGTVEQIRALGVDVVASGDLVSRFDAAWTGAMLTSHRAAGRVIDTAIAGAFRQVRQALDAGRPLDEYGLQQWIVAQMAASGVMAGGEFPIVAVNAHAGDPHYQPSASGSFRIAAGDLLLLDVWGRKDAPDTAFYDVTWMGYCLRPGETAPPERWAATFAVARTARDAGIACVEQAVGARRRICGFEVDQAVRGVVVDAGLGEFFVHRTGHSLGRDVHASGANLDDFETHDDRELLPHTGFTIEPGIYAPHGEPFGMRTEVNLYLGDGTVEVTGPRQSEIVRI